MGSKTKQRRKKKSKDWRNILYFGYCRWKISGEKNIEKGFEEDLSDQAKIQRVSFENLTIRETIQKKIQSNDFCSDQLNRIPMAVFLIQDDEGPFTI